MALVDRLMGQDSVGSKIPVDPFFCIVAEWRRGVITRAQAISQIASAAGSALTSGEEDDLDEVYADITGATDPHDRQREYNQVFIHAESVSPGHTDTPAKVRTRLGLS